MGNIVAKPSQLVFHKITFKDAVINDVNESKTEETFEKVLVYKRYDLPKDLDVKIVNQRMDHYYENEELSHEPFINDAFYENEIDTKLENKEDKTSQTGSYFKNENNGVYQFETFDAMD